MRVGTNDPYSGARSTIISIGVFRERIERFEDNFLPRQAIEAFFDEIIERSLRDKNRRGCLLVNSALKVAPHDREFLRVIANVLVQVESFFYRCAQAGQLDGSIAKSQSAKDIGRLLLGVLLAIRGPGTHSARSRFTRRSCQTRLRSYRRCRTAEEVAFSGTTQRLVQGERRADLNS
jgi:hypothetical protein